jgi:alpha-mannosidase
MKKPLYYTFGNHMHWVDMQWLWGYATLPGSARDMLSLIAATGAKGNVNFDGVGYEKLAAEAPDALAELREAVQAGTVEVVGASYGQPYGLFHGGESNIRQRVLGARAVRRLFGLWPRAFWEEEFDFFPQLPQILAGCGYQCASLFFQWTWSTPHFPDEPHALVLWEGLDGTRLPALPKNELCLHQWPEDFEGRLDSKLIASLATPAIVQWVELMPSPDWMCRSELLLPRLRELFGDPRFDLKPATLSELVAALALDNPEPPLRRYTLDDVFHGVSLGKNGDYMPRFSRTTEEQLLAAESASALAGLFGRPYPSWDVYPTWELEEAWRELCIAQHHDVHECEGLCGAIGERSFERSLAMSGDVFARTLEHLGRRVDALEGSTLVYNTLGWTRDVGHQHGVVRSVPAYGYKVIDPYDEIEEPRLGRIELEVGDEELVLARGDFEVHIDRASGLVTQMFSSAFPEGVLTRSRPIGALEMRRDDKLERFETVSFASDSAEDGEFAEFSFVREGRAGSRLHVVYSMSILHDALWIRLQGENLARPDGGMHNGLSTSLAPNFTPAKLLRDHPYGVDEVRAERDFVRKYPTGDWMTSPQVFETIKRPFTASTLVDMLENEAGKRGLLVVHDGSQAFFREQHGVRALLSMYDPWDGEHFDNVFDAELWVLPHGELSNTERMRISMECNLGSPRFEDSAAVAGGGDLPPTLGGLSVDCPNVLCTAFYRESRKAAEHVDDHFARDVRDPFVIRLVEFDGRAADVTLRLPGPVARAARTNLLGRVQEVLIPRAATPPFGPAQLPWSALRFTLKPHEIATVMVDLEFGRQVPRNLDEYRHVWATVHRAPKA